MVLSFETKTSKWFLGVLSLLALIISLVIFPLIKAEAFTILLELAEKRVQQDKDFVSEPINASGYVDLTFSFNYDATALDGFATSTGQDNFSYGWQIGDGDKQILGTILGLSGSTTDEHGVINVTLPEAASVENLVLFIEVSANSTTTSDKVEVRNISVKGNLKEDPEPVPGPVDICLNLDGVQAEIPTGYESKTSGNCTEVVTDSEPDDLCPNLDGNQEVVPERYEKDVQGDCVPVPPPVIDVCPNLDGVQSEIPSNYKQDNTGKCVPIVIQSEPEPGTAICPRGYARWVNQFNGGTIWQADDVYRSVILVGANDNNRRNFSMNRHVYIPGPTEVGDRYYHRFHKISYVCVR